MSTGSFNEDTFATKDAGDTRATTGSEQADTTSDSSGAHPLMERLAAVQDLRLYCDVIGSGPTTVMLPPAHLDSSVWELQRNVWSKWYQVVRLDLPGSGQSGASQETAPAIRTERGSYTDAVIALLKALGIEQGYIVGAMEGGEVALELALSGAIQVDAIVLMSTTPHGYRPDFSSLEPAERAQLQALLTQAQSDMESMATAFAHPDQEHAKLAAAAVESTMRSLFDQRAASLKTDVRERVQRSVADNLERTLRSLYVPIWRTPAAIQQLEAVRAPTLIVVGEHAPSGARLVAQELVRRIPNAQSTTIPGAGILANIEQPDVFDEVVLKFFQTACTSEPN